MRKEYFQEIRKRLLDRLDLSNELTDEEILEAIDSLILNEMRDMSCGLKEKVQLRQELFYSVRKLDVLQELIEDESVTEIMVNGPDAVFVEREGRLSRWNKAFTSREKLEDVIQQIVGKCNRVVNESMPIVDARLEGGARVNAEWPDPHYPAFSGYAHVNGTADCHRKSDCRVRRIFGKIGKSQIFHHYWRWDRKRQDDISGSAFPLYSRG